MRHYGIQLKSHLTGAIIQSAGGMCFVAQNGTPLKATLYNADGSSLSNPISLNRGFIDFHVADTVNMVDLFIMAPGGQFLVVKDVKPSGPNEVAIDTNQRHQLAVIPFSKTDQAGDATETDSGFNVPDGAMMLPNPGLMVTTADSAITLDVGTGGTSNDPNGFLAAASVGTLGLVKGTLTNGSATLGALLAVQDSANAGDKVPEGNVTAQADEDDITWTLLTAADTAEGFILLPYLLGAV